MSQKGATKIRTTTNAASRGAHALSHRSKVLANVISQVGSGQMAPKVFDRIPFGSIGRKILCRQPRGLSPQIDLHLCTPMSRQAIPQQDGLPPSQMTFQSSQIVPDVRLFDRAGVETQTQTDAAGSRCGHQTGNSRQAFPIERHYQDRGLPFRCPGAAYRRALGKSTFIQENQQRASPSGLFLMSGQRYFSQRRMLASLRSRALDVGRWQLQPSFPRSFQT